MLKQMAGEKILIVEDESIIALHIEDSLKSLGYAIAGISYSGSEAIRMAEESHPDLILMDIMLGGKVDGIRASEQIRTRLDIPVVYLTAYSDESTLQRAKATEPFGYLLKPFKERELSVAIQIGLYRHRMESERTQLILQLREALAQIKTMRGLLPICANCKKIRNDQGYWTQVEIYIAEHSDAEFTHGICPECLKSLYPELYAGKE